MEIITNIYCSFETPAPRNASKGAANAGLSLAEKLKHFEEERDPLSEAFADEIGSLEEAGEVDC